ncbi:MAG: YgeY family selenium metabolism-linked hydrolase [Chloroflexota bacterium]|nr:YgeY family selenium metabolism-linked hydrolase [Chloroflexota bacterium]
MTPLTPQDEKACIEFLQELIRIPSFSGQEAAVAARVADEMRRVGFPSVQRDRAGNIIGRIGSGERRLLFNGHMDIVGTGNRAAWTHDPFEAHVENAVLFGRGAVDMKSGLAAMIYGVKSLLARQPSLEGEIIVAAVVQEEPCEGMAMQILMEQEGLWPSHVVLGEPTNLQVALGQRGRVELRVETQGRACHSSSPHLGENALNAAAKVIFGIDLLGTRLAGDPDLGRGSMAVTGITCSANSRNAVPDHCELVIDRRLTLGETQERAVAEVRQIMEREGVKGQVRVAEYETRTYTGHVSRGREYYPPWLMPRDAPLVKQVIKSVARVTGKNPHSIIWPFSSDGTYTRGVAGVPTVGFGPGDPTLAHTVDEHVRLEDVLLAARGYAAIAQEIVGEKLAVGRF